MLVSEAKLLLHMASDVVHHLDIAQETRELSTAEFKLRRRLKRRILGLAVIERTRKRQASRIVNLREGDANTKFFHLKANARKRKNHIQRLQKDGGWAATHEEKATLIQEHFEAAMSPPPPQQRDFNWGNLNLQLFNLDHLVEPFTEKEIYEAILQTSPDKAQARTASLRHSSDLVGRSLRGT